MTAAARARLWQAAGLFAEANTPGEGRFSAFLGPMPTTLQMLAATPGWALAPPQGRRRYLRVVGAVATARAWRSSLAGPVLRPVAEAVGEDLVDAILAVDEAGLPVVSGLPQPPFCAEALAAVAASLLVRDAGLRVALGDRLGLAALDPSPAYASPEQLALAVGLSARLMREAGGR